MTKIPLILKNTEIKHRVINYLIGGSTDCCLYHDETKSSDGKELVIWNNWKSLPKRNRCRLCRISNKEIKGRKEERELLKQRCIDWSNRKQTDSMER